MNGVSRTVSDVLIPTATVIVTVVGILLAQNYRRQMALKLSQTRLDAYSRLWQITGIAAPTRLDGQGDCGYLQPEERRHLWAAMTDWYYAKGGGMLLADTTKEVYLNVKHNLVCKQADDLHPAGLAKPIRDALGLGKCDELDEQIRGALAIRLISLLRNQLKSDLTIYGPIYTGTLSRYECFFLEYSGVDLRSKAWAKAARLRRRRLPRLRLVRVSNPPVPGLPRLSPLRGMSPFLDVAEESWTPVSSRMAMRDSLRGVPAGSAEADCGTPKLLPNDCGIEH